MIGSLSFRRALPSSPRRSKPLVYENMMRMDVERQSISDCIVRVADEHGTNQQPDEEIKRDCFIGPFDTEQQAKDDCRGRHGEGKRRDVIEGAAGRGMLQVTGVPSAQVMWSNNDWPVGP
jgi:hypothetical protein